MSNITSSKILMTVIAAGAMQFVAVPATAGVDAVAAKKLAIANSCLRCHAISKKKEGPSYQAVAYKYAGNPDAPEILFKHLTSNEVIKASDGHSEHHKVVKVKTDDEIKNLVAWILMQ
jgi:cytochrome c